MSQIKLTPRTNSGQVDFYYDPDEISRVDPGRCFQLVNKIMNSMKQVAACIDRVDRLMDRCDRIQVGKVK